jgi:hypothetical protein
LFLCPTIPLLFAGVRRSTQMRPSIVYECFQNQRLSLGKLGLSPCNFIVCFVPAFPSSSAADAPLTDDEPGQLFATGEHICGFQTNHQRLFGFSFFCLPKSFPF